MSPTIEFFDDHIIDHEAGKRYALSCEWSPESIGSDIPEFLLAKNRPPRELVARGPTGPATSTLPPALDPRLEQSRKLEAQIAEARAAEAKAKNARGLAKIKAKHPDEKYDRKRKIWVPK